MLLNFAERHCREYLKREGLREPDRDETIAILEFDGEGPLTPDEFAQLDPPPPIKLLRQVWTYRELWV